MGFSFHDLLFSIVSLTNTQSFATRFYKPKTFMPKIFVPRLAKGAGISIEEARELLDKVPSLESKAWTHYWRDVGAKFESEEKFRAATMAYVMGCFPKENFVWKTEINELKRRAFQKWCAVSQAPFEERSVDTPQGKIRYYLAKPPHLTQRVPVALFLNGLEGSAEEFAFPLSPYLKDGIGFAGLSIPGSADYEFGMSVDSDKAFRYVIDDICRQPWVDSSKIGMVGFSFGAYWTLICSKTDPRIKFALCNGIPLTNTFNPKRSFGLNPIISYALLCMFRLRHPLQLLRVVKQLEERGMMVLNTKAGPLLCINGDCDTIVDPRDTLIVGNAANHKLLWLRGDDHCGLFHYDRMVQILVGWTKRCLREI
jgi:hypothetical protein